MPAIPPPFRPPTRGGARLAAAVVCLSLVAGPLGAQTRAATQYRISTWSQEDGLPQNSAMSAAQTTDGYLWIATQEGLARFDGTRFTVFDKTSTAAITTSDISVVEAGRNGDLWIGTGGGGVLRYRAGSFRAYSSDAGLPSGSILSLHEDERRALWIGTAEGLARLHRGRITPYGPEHGVPRAAINALAPARAGGVWVGVETGDLFRFDGAVHRVPAVASLREQGIQTLLEDDDGTLWIGTRNGLFRLRRDTLVTVPVVARSSDVFVKALHRDSGGSLWIGTRGYGLVRLRDGRAERLGTDQGLPSDDIVSLAEDRDGSLWVGTNDLGLAMLRAGTFVPFTEREGLSGRIVLPILEDRSGALWMGTYGQGLNRLEEGRVTVLTKRDGLSSDFVLSLAEAPDGALWIGTRNGLSHLQGGRLTTYGTDDGLPSEAVLALYTGPSGTVWVGTTAGLARIDGDRITSLGRTGGLASSVINALLTDRSGDLWIATIAGLGRLRDGRIETFTTAHGLASDFVVSLHEDSRGALWIGTTAGLTRFHAGRFATVDTGDGLFQDQVFRMLEDDHGHLWLSGNHGISRVALSELHAVADGTAESVTYRAYGEADGLPSSEANGGIQPAGWKDRRGRLWFPTIRGAAMVDPAVLDAERRSAPAIIERALVDGEVVASAGLEAPIRLPAGVGRLEIEYTGISFSSPAGTTFQYRLEGFDTTWVSAGGRRSATYTNLAPGSYRFLVRVRDRNQAWSEPARAELSIAPHFYETWPFRLLVVLALVAVAAAADRARVRRHRVREDELLALVEEREKAERRYRDLFENASDVVLTTDLDGRVTSLNRRGEDLLGRSKKEVIGRPLATFVSPESRAVVSGWAGGRTAREGASREPVQELELLASDGRRIPIEASVQSVFEEDRLVGTQAIMRDVAERHHLEEQLRQAQKMEAVGRLAGGIAHDFNNLLTVIAGSTEMALMDLPEGAEVRPDLEEVRRASERAANLTRQLLTFSRQQILQPKVLDLNQVITETATMLQRVIREDVEMITVLAADPAKICADSGQIEQVLMNLVVNAQDAMPTGGRLTLTTANVDGPVDAPGDPSPLRFVRLSVTDTGHGMDRQTQERIFEPFFTTKEPGKGTGLGLSTVYGIVQQSGGRLELESSVSRGTTFHIDLPLVLGGTSESTAPERRAESPHGGGETILLVEDEEPLRLLGRRVTERLGYRTLVAADGREAIRLSRAWEGTIDLLLTDVVMPGMSGPELAERLVGERPRLRVLYVSGHADDAIMNHGALQKGVHLLPKPYTPAVLAQALRDLLDDGQEHRGRPAAEQAGGE